MNFCLFIFKTAKFKIVYIKEINYYFQINSAKKIDEGDYHFTQPQLMEFLDEFKPDLKNIIVRHIEKLNKTKFDIEEYKTNALAGECTLCLHPSRKGNNYEADQNNTYGCNYNCNNRGNHSLYL